MPVFVWSLSPVNHLSSTSHTSSMAFHDSMYIHMTYLQPSDENWIRIVRYMYTDRQARVDASTILNMPNWAQWKQQQLTDAVGRNDLRRMRQLLTRGVLPVDGGQQPPVPGLTGHTLLTMCVFCNRLDMARLLLREMREDVRNQSMDAAALVELCIRNNRTHMRQLLWDEGGV